MKWNSKEGYVEYKAALDGVMNSLGLGAVDFTVRSELAPYLTGILRYLNKKLILLGSDDILEKLQEIFNIFDYGADLIVADEGLQLAKEVGIWIEGEEINPSSGDDENEDGEEGEVLDDGDEDEEEENENDETTEDFDLIPYDQDRFIFSWTNVMSCLVTRLKLQYSSLLTEPTIQGCGCCCGKGETWQDWESYSSGVWPEDEEYGTYDYGTTTTSWRVTSGIPQCGCSYRTSSTTN